MLKNMTKNENMKYWVSLNQGCFTHFHNFFISNFICLGGDASRGCVSVAFCSCHLMCSILVCNSSCIGMRYESAETVSGVKEREGGIAWEWRSCRECLWREGSMFLRKGMEFISLQCGWAAWMCGDRSVQECATERDVWSAAVADICSQRMTVWICLLMAMNERAENAQDSAQTMHCLVSAFN